MIKIYVVETKRVQMGDNWSISDLDAALSRVEGDCEYFATYADAVKAYTESARGAGFQFDTYDHYDFVELFELTVDLPGKAEDYSHEELVAACDDAVTVESIDCSGVEVM